MAVRRVAAVLLAAGASRRLGTPKQLLLDEHGTALVLRAAQQLVDAGCSPIMVVTGAEADSVALLVRDLPVEVVPNSAFEDGMGRSIACGVSAIANSPAATEVNGILIAACDMPTVDTDHIRSLIATSQLGTIRTSSEYVAREGGDGAPIVRGIPAVFPAADWRWLEALEGDRGAKPLLADHGTLSVRLFRGMFDVDTPADVEAWRAEFPPLSSISPPHMSMIAQSALADLEHEMSNTRRMLERVPEAKLDFSPHAKSWPLGKLANHITDFPWWGSFTLESSEIDFAAPFPPQVVPTTTAGFLQQFDERLTKFREALGQATDEQLMETWTVRNGETVLMAMPRVGILRGMVINHMIHHRAQLSIYLRMLDVPMPGMYGPSADEQ